MNIADRKTIRQKQCFQVGVEYYRAPMPPQSLWKEDFAAIRKAGFHIIRTFSYWNWMEPQRGVYELDDFDRFFALAAENGLDVLFDITLATHGTCPEWMLREHPDMRLVDKSGISIPSWAHAAAPQGAINHCYDHPKWKEYGSELIKAIVMRYKDALNLALWSIWDGIRQNNCYCAHSIATYISWLKSKYSLDELNERLYRRYRCWDDVCPPCFNDAIVEMMLFRQWQIENVAEKLKWQVDLVNSLDGKHDIHAHGCPMPEPCDEECSREVDSWGFSCPTNNYFPGNEASSPPCDHFFAMDWSRSIGKNGKWWFDEIYSSFVPNGCQYKKRTLPDELTTHMWMSLAYGAEGALFWQYRPEYLTFESPGLSLTGLNGLPLPRLTAVSKTIREIESVQEHFPLKIPRAEVAILYHSWSNELCSLGGGRNLYHEGLTKLYQALWEHNIPVDIITPDMDWEQYKLVCLTNTVLLDAKLIRKITGIVKNNPMTHIFADGLLGTNAADGRFSYNPPEGLSELLGVKTLDYSRLTERDIEKGANVLRTESASFKMTGACNYANLKTIGESKTFATFGDEVVGVQTRNKQFTWTTFTLSSVFNASVLYELLLPLIKACNLKPAFEIQSDKAIVLCRQSALRGWLIFVFNLEEKSAKVKITPSFALSQARDLLGTESLSVKDNSFIINVNPRTVSLVHCE